MAIKPYLQLVRLPNVFTAGADSLAGWLLVRGTFREPGHWLPLVFASACTYAGGIVLNDVFDVEVDRVERPKRPLPSGQVGLRRAALLGALLLAAGLGLAVLSSTRNGLGVELALIACVLGYDAGLKRSALGPEVMGACRGLNLLLGMSQAPGFGGPAAWLAAASYAVFVAGITWVSRSEVGGGPGKNVALGLTLQDSAVVGLVVASAYAGSFPAPDPYAHRWAFLGCAALGVLGFLVHRRSFRALLSPEPATIQGAVKFAIMSLVWVHAGLLLGVRGVVPALAVALFWLPAAYVGRWVYST